MGFAVKNAKIERQKSEDDDAEDDPRNDLCRHAEAMTRPFPPFAADLLRANDLDGAMRPGRDRR